MHAQLFCSSNRLISLFCYLVCGAVRMALLTVLYEQVSISPVALSAAIEVIESLNAHLKKVGTSKHVDTEPDAHAQPMVELSGVYGYPEYFNMKEFRQIGALAGTDDHEKRLAALREVPGHVILLHVSLENGAKSIFDDSEPCATRLLMNLHAQPEEGLATSISQAIHHWAAYVLSGGAQIDLIQPLLGSIDGSLRRPQRNSKVRILSFKNILKSIPSRALHKTIAQLMNCSNNSQDLQDSAQPPAPSSLSSQTSPFAQQSSRFKDNSLAASHLARHSKRMPMFIPDS